MGLSEAISAEAAAIRAQQASKSGRNAFGIDRKRYAGFKTPAMDAARMIYDPCCMLRDGDAKRESGDQYLWRKPDDPYTKSMCLRGVLKPVTADELDPLSPYANIDRHKIITSRGPREVVRTPGGLGLFVAKEGAKLDPLDQGLLPGEQWEAKYDEEISESKDQFSAELDTLSSTSVTSRVKGGIETRDTQREVIL